MTHPTATAQLLAQADDLAARLDHAWAALGPANGWGLDPVRIAQARGCLAAAVAHVNTAARMGGYQEAGE